MRQAATHGPRHGHAGQDGSPEPMPRPAWLTPVNVVIVLAALLALVLRLYRLTRPGLLVVTQYDDGPYFGSAVRLVHGSLPYRDFVLVQPPGITLLMSPAGLLTKVTGTAWGMVVGRLLTVAASTAAVVLAGLLVRHRGLLAVLITCGIAAVYPAAVGAAHTVLLEPWLVLFCLAGAVAVFDGDRLASTRRLAWAGVAFGFAGAVKTWAIAPVLVILVLCLPQIRRAAIFAAAVAAGFALPVLPFAAIAPRQFYDSVIRAQLARTGAGAPVWYRLADMIGIPSARTWPHATVLLAAVIIVLFVAGAYAITWYRTGRPPTALDWFAVATAALVASMALWAPFYAPHYTAFLMPFIGLSLALPVSRLAADDGPLAGRPGLRKRLGVLVAGLVGLAVLTGCISQAGAVAKARPGPAAAIHRVIPARACVLSDQVSYLLLADRFVSGIPGCPAMVDGLGTDLALSGGRSPETGAARVPAVVAAWRQAFGHAQYLLLSAKNSLRVAWTPALRAYVHDSFRQVLHTRDYVVYVRRR
jgi:hypothetical protein